MHPLTRTGNMIGRSRRFHTILLSVGTIIFLIALWVFLTPEHVSELTFPSPHSVWEAVKVLRLNLVEHSIYTLGRVLAGWVLGAVLGIVIGLAMTWSRVFYSVVNPVIEAVRPLPPIALIPFFIIWFGLSVSGQIILIALGCFMVLAVNTYVAVQNLPAIYVQAASSFGASRRQIYWTVIIPAILPTLVSGFRIAAALAFGTAVAAEFMGAQSGLGYMIMVARRTLNTNTILLGTIIIGLESFLLDSFIRWLSRRRFMSWSETPLEVIQQLGAKV
jgi:ABC-type nitrate/sulfonate/bicarbonate transport system permease component